MELLAPAGNAETFLAAVDAGADAVYVGAPGFNARNLARDIRLEEIGAMIEYCHARGRKLYLAFNSLLLENELAGVVETLAALEYLAPDALIVQDYALIKLIRQHFPRLVVHGSTLMTATNSDAVNFLGKLGCKRVVLARELTLKEIATVNARKDDIELEVFIHGAMCFSYSGLCLFSSYLGGKSGLRGRCVQPCRRNYRIESGKGKKAGQRGSGGSGAKYLFSMNDLSGLDAIPELQKLNVASLKIEGRLRTAHYIRSVVSAYRMVLDSSPDAIEKVLVEARALIDGSMSRRTAPGYFFSPQPAEAITAHHSGNMGLHLGRFSAVKKVGKNDICRFVLKHDLAVGDRLRLHAEPSGERVPFTLKSLFVEGHPAECASAGVKVSFALPAGFSAPASGHVEVYKVDQASLTGNSDELARLTAGCKAKLTSFNGKIQRKVSLISGEFQVERDVVGDSPRNTVSAPSVRKGEGDRASARLWPELWLKVDAAKSLRHNILNFPFTQYLLVANDQTLAEVSVVKRLMGNRARQLIWSLPPVILVNELEKWRRKVRELCRTGFRNFQIGHLSQIELFAGEKVSLFGDYSLNIMNSQAATLAYEAGVEALQCAIEIDREALDNLRWGIRAIPVQAGFTGKKLHSLRLGVTVFGAPALYTSRIAAEHFRYEQEVLSPKDEGYIVLKKDGGTQTYPVRPFSLIPFLPELREMGISYGVVDISGRSFSKRELEELAIRLSGKGKASKLPTFNYLGKLI